MERGVGAHLAGESLVVTYHYVRPANSDGVTGITPEEFARQIGLVRETHRIVGVDEFVALSHVSGGMRGRPLALITFDDAVKDQRRHALPVLQRLRVPAVFFAPMRPVDPALSTLEAWTPQHLVHALAEAMGWDALEREVRREVGEVAVDRARMDALYHYEKPAKRWLKFVLAFVVPAERAWAMLDWINRDGPRLGAHDWFMSAEELVDLQRRGHAIGAHGYDHLPYSSLRPLEQAWDMARAARVMSRLLGERGRTIAFPFGRHDACTDRLVREFGYRHAFTTEDRVDCKFLEEALARRAAA
jgi:peptidoglycan/xylan/chitin deacetylase (PgdA/CDA1 family)